MCQLIAVTIWFSCFVCWCRNSCDCHSHVKKCTEGILSCLFLCSSRKSLRTLILIESVAQGAVSNLDLRIPDGILSDGHGFHRIWHCSVPMLIYFEVAHLSVTDVPFQEEMAFFLVDMEFREKAKQLLTSREVFAIFFFLVFAMVPWVEVWIVIAMSTCHVFLERWWTLWGVLGTQQCEWWTTRLELRCQNLSFDGNNIFSGQELDC